MTRAALLVLVALVAVATPAWAEPKARLSVLGQPAVATPFLVELAVEGLEGTLTQVPTVTMPKGLSAKGPSIRPIVEGVQTRTGVRWIMGFAATWQVTAARAGRFTVGPGVLVWNGARITAPPMTVDVSATAPPASPFSPFLLPGGPLTMPGMPTFGEDADEDRTPTSELGLQTAPDPDAFIRVKVDKTSAVVGEPVVAKYYFYYTSSVDLLERHDAQLRDFLRYDLDRNPDTDTRPFAIVGGKRFRVALLAHDALFPLHAGDLHLGTMSGLVTTRRGGQTSKRESNDVVIHVSEPPALGRPPGYVLGDVGRFTLSGTVQPRLVDQDGAVAVVIQVEGRGSFPQKLRVPARTGVEWLDPERREHLDAQGGTVSGTRTFGYVVRLRDSGSIALGTVALPYWDPDAKKYETASVDLGTIEVKASEHASKSAPVDEDGTRERLAGMPPVRGALAAWTPPAPPPLAGWRLWAALLVGPAGVVGALAAARGWRAQRVRRREGAEAPATLARAALREATEAAERGDAKAVAAAAERAVHHAIEGATGLKARGVLLDDLTRELEGCGVAAALAASATAVIEACARVRFEPGATTASLSETVDDARGVVSELIGSGSPPSSRTPPSSRRSAAAIALALCMLAAATARAQPAEEDAAVFARGAAALSRGEYESAIDAFEVLADHGFVHPDASFDRGLAYVARVREGAERPGDLGRAAAAFEEAEALRRGDEEADHAADVVRAEVVRRRAASGQPSASATPTLDRALVGLASERAWTFAAIAASLLLAAGIVLHRRRGRLHVAGVVLAPVAGVALVLLAPLAWGARELRLGRRAAVVVVPDVRLADATGKPLPGDPVPEAALVEIVPAPAGAALVRVRWGSAEGWAPPSAVHVLAR